MTPMSEKDALRFWGYVDRRDEGCWNWLSWTMTVGYGCFLIGGRKGKKYGAHRLSYEMHNGPIPKGKLVLHSCDNRLCVRPDHLRVGTHKENTQDMISKGRGLIGEKSGHAKLNDEKVRKIRRLHAAGYANATGLAAMYGVTQSNISMILSRKTWAHLAA
jgi:hypothetical protein